MNTKSSSLEKLGYYGSLILTSVPSIVFVTLVVDYLL